MADIPVNFYSCGTEDLTLLDANLTVSNTYGSYTKDRTIDGDFATFWYSYPEAVSWWKNDFGIGGEKDVIKVTLYPYYAHSYSCLKDFNIQGSQNDSDWDTLFTDQQPNTASAFVCEFTNGTAYRYYKINLLSTWYPSPNNLGLSEVIFAVATARAATPINFYSFNGEKTLVTF